MKKIIIVSIYVLISIAMFSCTNDEVESIPNNKIHKVEATVPNNITQPPKP